MVAVGTLLVFIGTTLGWFDSCYWMQGCDLEPTVSRCFDCCKYCLDEFACQQKCLGQPSAVAARELSGYAMRAQAGDVHAAEILLAARGSNPDQYVREVASVFVAETPLAVAMLHSEQGDLR